MMSIVLSKKRRRKRKAVVQEYDQNAIATKKASKWKFLEHNGPYFPPPYKPLPDRILFRYDNKRMKLSPKAEEIATFYAKISKKETLEDPIFQTNFFHDWREAMEDDEKAVIADLTKCDFRDITNYFNYEKKIETEIAKAKRLKKCTEVKERHGFCTIDGRREELENFKIETGGLFLGRGEHPKIGRVKAKISPEDVTINCSRESKIPELNWKEVVHDETVTWLAKWRDNVLNTPYYMQLKTKSWDDRQKFDKAKELDGEIQKIRDKYFEDLYREDEAIIIRERAVGLYLIDQLGFRTGNEKNDDEADTFGCCSLQVKHVKLFDDGETAVFDFLGKSWIRYHAEVSIQGKVFKNLQQFQAEKSSEDPLFDHLTSVELNSHLRTQMNGLTAKVFRTYNASYLFEKFLELFTDPRSADDEKVRCYKCANLVVAIFLNHRTTAENEDKKEQVMKVKKVIHEVVAKMRDFEFDGAQIRRLLQDLKGLLFKNTEILMGTSKENNLDPRISVAWCQKFEIAMERVFTVTQRKKFDWANKKQYGNFRFSTNSGGTLTCVQQQDKIKIEEDGFETFWKAS